MSHNKKNRPTAWSNPRSWYRNGKLKRGRTSPSALVAIHNKGIVNIPMGIIESVTISRGVPPHKPCRILANRDMRVHCAQFIPTGEAIHVAQ